MRIHDTSIIEPAASFASNSEIQRAEQLRYQLERRYFGPSLRPLVQRPVAGHASQRKSRDRVSR